MQILGAPSGDEYMQPGPDSYAAGTMIRLTDTMKNESFILTNWKSKR